MESKKFGDLTKKEKDYIKHIYSDKNIRFDDRILKIREYLNRSDRTVRKWLVELGCKKENAPTGKKKVVSEEVKEPSHLELAKQKTLDGTKKRFIITSAQNATPVLDNFFKGLIYYSDTIQASLIVCPFRYHNPTSLFSDKQETQEWWSSELVPYLALNRFSLADKLMLLADVKIQPTASDPLQGMESMTAEQSCIVPHVRMELRSIAGIDEPKYLLTTGTCTKPNYTDSKAGKKGEFHHSYGFVIVEVDDDGQFYFRQVSANSNGEFIDLFYHVNGDVITKEDSVDGLIMGDIHCRHFDPRVGEATFNDLCKKLYPKKLVLHDIIDSESVSHHNLNNPFILHKQEIDGTNSLQEEINEMLEWLKKVEQYDVYIVKSNHDEHIDRFLQETDWRRMSTLKNAEIYMTLATAKLKGEAPKGAVNWVINQHYPKINTLDYFDKLLIGSFICNFHGHVSSNGSRGSLKAFSKLPLKVCSAHSHSVGRCAGSCVVGHSTKGRETMSYLRGPSSWSQAHGIINRLGKFQHIIFRETKDGSLKYTTLEY